MFLKEIKHDFFGLLVSMLVSLFSENIDSHGAQQLSLRHCDKPLEKKLGFGQAFMLPAARKYLLFLVDSLMALFELLFCIALPLFFVFAYYMMPPVVWISKTTSPLKAFVCLYAWRRLIIKILTLFINNLKKKTKWLTKQLSCYK